MAQTLVFHQAALGDWVLTFPILRSLPKPLRVVTTAEKARLAAGVVGDLTGTDVDDLPWHRLFQAELPGQDAEPLVPVLRQAPLIVSYTSDGADVWARNVRRLAPGARLVFIQERPPGDFKGHVLDWQMVQLARQGLPLAAVQPPPRFNPAGPIVVHPGSGGPAKCWGRERLVELVAVLAGQGLEVAPVLGEVELDTWAQAELDHWCRRMRARFCQSLADLHDLLSWARMFVGNDSGPTHLAAQMGVPTLALFGPSDPRQWSPTGPVVRVLAPPQPCAMDWLSVGEVSEAVGELLERRRASVARRSGPA